MASTVYSVPALVLTAVDKVMQGTYVGGVYNLGMKDGVVDISGYNSFEDTIPQQVKTLIADTKAKILDGSLKVPVIESK
jgi:basic membrane protein A